MDKNGFHRGYSPTKLASKEIGYLTPNRNIPFGNFEQSNHIPVVIRDLNGIMARHRDSVWVAADLISIVMSIFTVQGFVSALLNWLN